MTYRKFGNAAKLRALFEATPGLSITTREANDRLGVEGWKLRQNVRRTLHDLVDAGYLHKEGEGAAGKYTATGAGMRRAILTPEQRAERTRAINRASKARGRERRALAGSAARLQRVAKLAGLAPAKPHGHQQQERPAQTVEEFERAGGVVQRLPASWDRDE